MTRPRLIALLALTALSCWGEACAKPVIFHDPGNSLRPESFPDIPASVTLAGFAPNDLSASVRTDVTPTTRAGVIEIAGGDYATPYNANTADREYKLMGNVTFEGCGILTGANHITINLNGFDLTWKTTKMEGVETATVTSIGGGGGSARPTLVPSGLTLSSNSHLWHIVEFLDGPEAGNLYDVYSNDATTLTLESQNGVVSTGADSYVWYGGGPDPGDSFRIYDPRDTGGICSNSTTFNRDDIEIVNGTITEGDSYGRGASVAGNAGCNPIGMAYSGTDWRVAGVTCTYDADNANGISLKGSGHIVEFSELHDEGTVNTARQRSLGAIVSGNEATVRQCRIPTRRHIGVYIDDDTLVEECEIAGDTRATNAPCVMAFLADNAVIRNNNLYSIGEHPYGVGVHGLSGGVGPGGCEVYGNWIESETTRMSSEYPGDSNYAGGISNRWGTRPAGNHFHDNAMLVYANGVFKCRGLMLGALDSAYSELYEDNFIGASSEDGAACYVFGGGTNNDTLVIRDNIVESTHSIFFLSDTYGFPETGRRYINNDISKVGSDPSFATFYNETTFFSCNFDLISNTFNAGTSATDLAGSYDSGNIIRDGYLLTVTVTDGGSPVEGATVTVRDKDSNILRDDFLTDATGVVVIDVPTSTRTGASFTPVTLNPLTVEAALGAATGNNTISPTSDDSISVGIAE